MLNPLNYHVTTRKLTNLRKGKLMASFDELAHAMSYAHNRRKDLKNTHEVVVWCGASVVERPEDWNFQGSMTGTAAY